MDSDLRSKFRKELLEYSSNYSEELVFRERMIELLDYENCFNRSLLHAHFTASVWVLNSSRNAALFTHHAKLNRWLQIGGHADGDEDLKKVASKEMIEESGIQEFTFLNDSFFDIDIHTIPERKGVPEHEHFDVRFLMEASDRAALVISEESHDLAWIKFDQIAEYTDANASIMRMLSKSQRKLI